MKYLLTIIVLISLGCNERQYNNEDVEAIAKYFDHRILIDSIVDSHVNPQGLTFYNAKLSYLDVAIKNPEDSQENGEFQVIDLNKKLLSFRVRNILQYTTVHSFLYEDSFYVGSASNFPEIYTFNILDSGKAKFERTVQLKYTNINGMSFSRRADLFFFEDSPLGPSAVRISDNNVYNRRQGVVVNYNYSTFAKPLSDTLNLMCGYSDYYGDSIALICFDSNFNIRWERKIKYQDETLPFFAIFSTSREFIVCRNNGIVSFEKTSGFESWSTTLKRKFNAAFIQDDKLYIVTKKDNEPDSTYLINSYECNSGNKVNEITIKVDKEEPLYVSNNDKFMFLSNSKEWVVVGLTSLLMVDRIAIKDFSPIWNYTDGFDNKKYTVMEGYIFW